MYQLNEFSHTLDETIDLHQIFSDANLCKLRDKSLQMW